MIGISGEDIIHDNCQLADVLREQGRYKDGENLFRKIAERSKTFLGPDHPETLCSYSSIASCLSSQGLFDESELLLRTTLEQQLQMLGDMDPQTIITMCELANVLEETKRPKEALTLRETIFRGAGQK